MKIQTFSIVVGTEACNARCPFCVSGMTHSYGMSLKESNVNWRNFKKACEFANRTNVTTVMLTGKGEPTLFPDQVTEYLKNMEKYNFPIIELQTNGVLIHDKWNDPNRNFEKYLKEWYDLGLTTICISNVGIDKEKNRQIYLPHKKEYIDLKVLVEKIHSKGITTRLTTVLIDGGVDSSIKLKELIKFCKDNKIKQLSICPVNKPQENNSRNDEIYNWIGDNFLKEESLLEIKEYMKNNGVILNYLAHGAVVYDVDNQNVCFRNCLTIDPNSEQLRNLIFFPNGDLRTDWEHGGAVIL